MSDPRSKVAEFLRERAATAARYAPRPDDEDDEPSYDPQVALEEAVEASVRLEYDPSGAEALKTREPGKTRNCAE